MSVTTETREAEVCVTQLAVKHGPQFLSMPLHSSTLLTLPLGEASVLDPRINGCHCVSPINMHHVTPFSMVALFAQVNLAPGAVETHLERGREGGDGTLIHPSAYLAGETTEHTLTGVTAPLSSGLRVADGRFGWL